ncbi:MAG: alpha/beta hydrolase [Gammaproteobacteria bacterium]|nr:alpha/beta hydrolase [Gammaproteobacteria bacterium]
MVESLEHWRRGGAAFKWRGHNIFVRRAGAEAAPVLLLIHGFPTASWDYAPIWEALAGRWRVLTLDMLGFGFSAKPRNCRYPLADQADLLEAFLRAESVTNYHVLAHDYGDTVAQELVARNADAPKLHSVCLLNGGIFPEAHRPLLIQRLLASFAGSLVARLSTRTTFAVSMRRIFASQRQPTAEELDSLWALVTHNNGRAVMAPVSRYRLERRPMRPRWVGALQTTTIPLRLIVGTDDPIAGTAMAERYRQLVPRPDVVELPGVGHYPQIEAPDRVLRAYDDFRARCA